MNDTKIIDANAMHDRVTADLVDSLDEELEMELDDDRLDKLLAETAGKHESEAIERRVYFKELFRLQGELVKLQDWVQHNKLKVVVIFEGRDAAGKGGVIADHALNPHLGHGVAGAGRERAVVLQRYARIFRPAAIVLSTAAGTAAPASNAS